MTAWSRVLYRVLACGFWWAALCLLVAAFMLEGRWLTLGLFVAGCMAVGLGIGLWKGEAT